VIRAKQIEAVVKAETDQGNVRQKEVAVKEVAVKEVAVEELKVKKDEEHDWSKEDADELKRSAFTSYINLTQASL
jgi:hypothetical protein